MTSKKLIKAAKNYTKLGYKPRHIIEHTKHFFRESVNLIERAKYGIGNRDTWYFGDWLQIVTVNGLRELAETAHGWPGTDEFPEFEDWTKKLNEVADTLESCISIDGKDPFEDDKLWTIYKDLVKMYGGSDKRTKEAYDIWVNDMIERKHDINNKRRECFLWIAEHCDQLWD